MIGLNNFRNQPFVAVSGNPGVKVLVVDNVLSSHEQDFFPLLLLMKTALSFNFKHIETFTWICDKLTLL